MINSLWRDLRFGLRGLVRQPGFTAVSVLTLTLGVGATTSIFSFVHGVLLRPLPYPEPDRIVMVCETSPERPAGWCGASPANWADWTRSSRTMEALGLARDWPFGIRRDGRSRGVSGGIATPGLFQVFTVAPAAGRVFEPADIQPGGDAVAVVSHSFWRSWLGGDADAVGRRLEIDGREHEIVGVLPFGFEVPNLEHVEVWIPLWPERLGERWRGWRGLMSFGRLRGGVSLEEARVEFAALREQLAGDFPEANAAWGVVVDSLHDRTVRAVRPALQAFLAAGLLVLLIACVNIANLLLARGSAREREFAVRMALGAGGARLARQLLTESLLVSAAGGAAGALLAYWAVDLFTALAPGWFPRLAEVRVDPAVLVFAVGISVAASLVFSLAPMLQALRLDLNESLREGRGTATRRGAGRLREALVVLEVALACVLLVGAGLLLRSFGNLLDWRPGFDRSNLLFVQVFSSPGKYPTIEPVIELYARAVEELGALPGVVSAGAGSAAPLFGGDGEQEFFIEGRPVPAPGERSAVAWFDVDPGYFATLGIPLVRGRTFTPGDRRGAPLVAVVNQAMAERHWPAQDPVGQRVHVAAHDVTLEVVGVVGNVQPFRSDQPPQPQIYWPFAQLPRWATYFIVRTAGDSAGVAAAIRARLEALDPDMDVGTIHTMDERVAAQLVNPRFNLTLAGVMALLAAALATVGVYGVMAFAVARRMRELGMRLALGATRGEILRLVLARGMALVLAGLVLGLAGAFAVTGLLRSLLVGVEPGDPLTFVAVAVLLSAVALAACWLPARRAARTDPLVALRYE